MNILSGRLEQSKMTYEEVVQLSKDAFKKFNDPYGLSKSQLSKKECRTMIESLFLEDLDMGVEMSNRIFEQMYLSMDLNKNGFIDQKELTEYFVRMADKENCIAIQGQHDWPLEDDD